MSEVQQSQKKLDSVDQQESQKKEVLPQQIARKSIIDLKKIQTDDPNHKNVIQNPNTVDGTPSLQVIDDQQEKLKGQTSFGEALNQNQHEENIQAKNQQRNSINLNLQNAGQFSPKKGDYNSSLSPKRRMMQQGGNTPCISPLPDLKVQRSKFDVSQTQFFITNINAFRGLESFPKINELHNQISSIIDDLEGKLDTVVERHEAEFLFAYRNHMSKIKQEMVDMKKQAEEQEKRLNDNDRVAGLERQIVWLRDECLALYKIIGKKKDDLACRERTIRDLQRDNQHLQNQIKELMKKNKLLQMKIPIQGITNQTQIDLNNNTQQSIIGLQDQINMQSPVQSPKQSQQSPKQQKNQQDEGNQDTLFQSQYQESVSKQQNNIRQEDEMYITQNVQMINLPQQQTQISPTIASSKRASLQNQNIQQSQQINFEQIITKQQVSILEEANPEFGSQIISIVKKNIEGEISVAQLIHEIAQYCKIITDRKQKQYKQVKDKLEKTLKEKLKMGMARSDLETFFLECVETARKQIIKRKYVAGGSANQTAKKGEQNGLSQTNQNSIFQSPNKNMGDFVESIKDYKVFRSEDKVKILELLLSHEKLMMYLYQKIFPTHFNVHLQNALENQEDIPLYLRPQKNSQNNNKFININDHQFSGSSAKNQENYLDLLTEEDPSVQNFQDNIIYQNGNSKSNDFKTKLPSLQESQQNQNILNLYQVNAKNKRNSVDHKGAYDFSNPSSLQEYSSAMSKPSTQISRLGSLNNKYIQQRNYSQRNTNRSSNYDAFSDQKNKSISRNIGDSSFDDSKQISYNIRSDLQQINASEHVLSLTSPLTNSSAKNQENRIVQDKLNIINGKLAFKNI
ncbi:myosin heavy chain, putative (macronuclear) [Tetrahymena thermophila SB210]|uniref:Myosin heavy chain, putative n=1 Tax=Tetrahymena thermophila (strain SB210) TaxID=312017 RepID=I7MAU4_TETTS|nr:myosin heavy chain, putative [Tetrahymena thermophila SB210]EAS06159.1 myosin heavy chain, putative [Tetrahymena thermophila SB210]|eukprot:XP_001026404.1 myosin heavy chain, putative [Tetrahymena thermophila SB210]